MSLISLEEMNERDKLRNPTGGRLISLEEMDAIQGKKPPLPAPSEGSYVSPAGATFVQPRSGKRAVQPEQPKAAPVIPPPSDQPEMRAYEPTIWERIGDLLPQNFAKAANEYAARERAKELKIPVNEAYRQMKEDVGVRGILGSRPSGQPMWNPEGRSPIATAVKQTPYALESVLDAPKGAVESALKFVRSGDIAKPYDSSLIDKAITYLGDDANDIFIPNLPEKLGLDPKDPEYAAIAGFGKSLGASLMSIVPQYIAEAGTTAVTANPLVGAGAGISVGAAMAYRPSVDDFMVRVRDKLNAESKKIFGRPMDEKEWNAAKEKYKNLAREYGAWEAGTEAIANALFLKAFAAPLKAAKGATLKKYLSQVVSVGSEMVGETITGLGHNSVELRARLTDDELTVADAFKQQFIQTMLTMGVMAGGVKAIQAGNRFYETQVLPHINPDSALAKAIKNDIDLVALKQAAPLRTLNEVNIKGSKQVAPSEAYAAPTPSPAKLSRTIVMPAGNAPKPAASDEEDEQVPGMPSDDEIEEDTEDATRLTPVSLATQTPAAAALPVTPTVAPISGKPPADPPPGNLEVKGLPTQEIPLSSLKLSKDVPQFKLGATSEGVVEPLGGKFERTGVAPIQVWQRLDGTLEVISGRHRFDLAKRSGEETIPAQVHSEAQGFDQKQAAILDAELNIRDGQGKVKDYVNYFKESGIDRNTAHSRGLLARATGKRSYTIATQGSDDLIAAVRNDQIGDEAAYYIALNAPNNDRLQAVGINAIQEGKSANTATNIMQAVKTLGGERDTTQDMFGFDDSAIKEAEEMAKIASRKQREIQTRLSAITGAAKNPAMAKAEGIDIRDEKAVQRRINELRQLKAAWDNWSTNPQLVAEIWAERGEPAPVLTPVEQPKAEPLWMQTEDFEIAKHPLDAEILNLRRIAAASQRQGLGIDVESMASDALKNSGRLQEVSWQKPVGPSLFEQPKDFVLTKPSTVQSQKLPRELAGAKPRYSYGDKQFELTFESDVDKAAYIASQPKPSKRDADYVQFVMDATGLSEEEVRAHGQIIRGNIKATAKTAEPGMLNVPATVPKRDLVLTQPSVEELKQKSEREAAEAKRLKEEQEAAERKAKADREAKNFTLTGSDSPADIAIAYGQQELVPAASGVEAEDAVSTSKLPESISEAINNELKRQKRAVAQAKRDSQNPDFTLRQRADASQAYNLANSALQRMRANIFNAEDAAADALKNNDAKAFEDYAGLFPKAAKEIEKSIAATKTDQFAGNKLFTSDAVAKAKERMKQRLNRLNAGIDPEMVMDGLIIAGAYIENGVRKFSDYAKAMTDEFGPKIKPYLLSFYEAARNYPGLDVKGLTPADEAKREFDLLNRQTEGEKDEPTELGESSTGELEGAQPETIQGTGEGEETGGGTTGGGGEDVSGGVGTGGQRSKSSGRMGDDKGEVSADKAGTKKRDIQVGGTGTNQRSDRTQQPDIEDAQSGGNPGLKPASGTRSQDRADDFIITDEDEIGEGGAKTKYKQNIAAIRLLKQLATEKRQATREEQAVLAKYVGWGGIPQAFYRDNNEVSKGWEKEAKELKELLTPEELEAAAASTRNAHYTSTEIVSAMWDAIKHFGYQGGRVLEPSVGVGNFFGVMPTGLRKSSQLTGVELDHITGGIAKQLYPQANIAAPVGFQDFSAPDNYFDLAIGNPPFGQEGIYDASNRKISGFSIHNYFFAKSLNTVRPNGVLAMVVTNRLLDSVGDKARSYIAERSQFLGAIRLPNDAFAKNAGTQVTTDIIFLRKLKEGEEPTGQSWMDVRQYKDKNGNTVLLNEYFIRNPDMMLGDFGQFGSMYSAEDAALVAREGQDTPALLKDAIKKLPGKFMDPPTSAPVLETVEPMNDVSHVKIGSMFEQDGKIFVRKPDLLNKQQAFPVEFASGMAEKRVRGMIGVRDAFITVRGMQLDENADEKKLEQAREKLNETYDAFVAEYGLINTDVNKRLMRDDPTWPQMSALEEGYDKGISATTAKKTGDKARPPSAKKADIFTKRTQKPYKRPDKASSAKDAMLISMAEYGSINLDYMASIYGKTHSAIISELDGLIYLNPQGGWESKDQYLSGNVKKKLAQAIEAAKTNPNMEANVEALKAVQPTDIEAIDIDVKIGSPWLPADVMQDFVMHITKALEPEAVYNPINATWRLSALNIPSSVSAQWGTERSRVMEVLNAAANHKQIVITDTMPDDKRVSNVEATAAANEKVNEVKEEWKRWVWADDNRRARLHRIYNDTFNTDVLQQFDGEFLKLPGKVGDDVIKLYPHQLNFVWRGLQNGVVLADHVVGAGKTFSLIALAMEKRRIGQAKKPMLVVPNHLVGQWAADFAKLYPNANILATTKNDFLEENRKKLFARIATGDWDAVIVAHSSFGKVEVSPEYQSQFIEAQIEDCVTSIEAMRNLEGKKSRNVKQIQKQKASLEEKLKKLLDTGSKDDNLTFEELGVDALFVDEFHEFKNLAFSTSMKVSGLGNPTGSLKATDMFLKVQSILKSTGGKNIVVATGTPVSNTMAEMYTMQRYLDYQNLKDQGISHFDAWARTFGEVVTDWELSPSGQYKMSSKFSKFVNLPELMMRYQSFADVINRDDINKQLAASGKTLPIPKIKGGKPENVVVNRSSDQAEYIGVPRVDKNGRETYPETSLIWRSEHLPKKAEKGADNMLKIMSDARKAALDMRLIDPNFGDNPLSKVNVAAENILHIYKKWDSDKGTQLVFCDLSTPKSSVSKEKAELKELIALAEEGNEDAQEKLDNMSPDDLMALDGEFSVYDDLKEKLIALGIPANEIAFIHDANTDIRKEELFAKVRSGMVRVLLGSTSKMGAGMNVQERLVALHHLDAPWRPSDLEQREGRIIRQGNKLFDKDPQGFEIEILRYATKQTLDSRMWQTLETKARFIEQVRKGTGERQAEDIGSEAANSAEMKAASSGNPLILEEMTLRKTIRDLETQRYNHERNQHRIRDIIRIKKAYIDNTLKKKTKTMDADLEFAPKKFAATIYGKTYEKQSEIGAAILDAAKKMRADKKDSEEIGNYGGFKLIIDVYSSQLGGLHATLTIKGKGEYQIDANPDASDVGLGVRLRNAVPDLQKINDLKAEIKKEEDEVVNLESQAAPWDKESELQAVKGRHSEIIEKLKPKEKPEQEPIDEANKKPIEKVVKQEYTPEQRKLAQRHADDFGGEVAWQRGDYALIRGYSALSGDPVYIPTMGDMCARVDVESFTGKQLASDVKQEMIAAKQEIEAAAARKHQEAPFITFQDGLAMSPDIPEQLAGVIKDWKSMLKLDVPIYVSTIEDARANRNNFTGPHRRIGSGTLNASELGSMRMMPDGSYYILFTKSTSPTKMLETIAHEMGHVHQRLFYERATPAEREALRDAHSKWLEEHKGKTAQELIDSMRARSTGRAVKIREGMPASELGSYWSLFGEWYADQTARWAMSSERPVSIVEKYFKRLGIQLRRFFQQLKAKKYLPNETFAEYIEQVTSRSENIPLANIDADLMGKPAPSETNQFAKRTKEEIRQETINQYKGLRAKLGRLPTQIAKGEVGLDLQKTVTELLQKTSELKREIETTKPRRDSAEVFLAKALTEYSNGNISKEVLDVIQAAYQKAPALLEGLQLSVVKPEKNGKANARFDPINRIVALFKETTGVVNPSTIRHELTHSLEQMMTPDQQMVVVQSWLKALQQAIKKYPEEKHQEYFRAVLNFFNEPNDINYKAALDILPNYEMYQFLNPSEYWAINAEKLLAAELGTAWDKFKRAVRQLWEGLKKVLGFDNRYDVHKVFKQVMGGGMERINYSSIVQGAVENISEYSQTLADIKPSTEFWEDIPNEEWLEGKIKTATQSPRNEFGVPRMGVVTGYFSGPVYVPTKWFSDVKGESGEQQNVRTKTLAGIRKVIRETGRFPIMEGSEYVPFIRIGFDGMPWISEGNHRIMAALEEGIEYIPIEIRYFDGGQRRADKWQPNNLIDIQSSKNVVAAVEGRDAAKRSQTFDVPLLDIDDEKLLKKYSRPNTPTTSDETIKDLAVDSAVKAKKIFKDAVKDPKGAAAKVGNTLTDAILEARNQAVFYGAGLEARDFARYGGELRTAQDLVTASVALDNAIRSGNIAQEVLFRGGIRYNPASGMYEAVQTKKGMHGVYDAQKKLLDKLGKQVGTDIIQGYLEAKRSISITNEYLDREAKYQQALGAFESALARGADLQLIESFKMLADSLQKDVEQIKKALSSVNMSDEEMYEFAALEDKHPELRDIMDNWTAVSQNLLKMWMGVKLIPRERYESLSKIKDYVPWYRIMDDGLDMHDPDQSAPKTTTRAMTNIGREKLFKRGKPTAVIDFRAKAGQKEFKIQPSSSVEVEVNGVPVSQSQLSVTADGKVTINLPLKENDLVVFKTHREIQNIIDNMTNNVMRMTINGLRQYAANRIVMEYASRNQKGKVMLFPKEDRNKGRFAWMLNGKKVFVEIQDPLVVQAIYGMENMNLKMFAPMAAVANLTRRTITLSPAFQVAQVFKDAPTAALVTGVKNPMALIGGVWKGFLTSLTGTEPVAEILKAAGIGGYYSPARTADDEVKRRLGVMNGNVYDKFIRALDHISDASDMAQRVAVYKRVMAETNDEMLAKYQAANVFNQMRHGASPYAQLFTRTIPFANAYAVTIDKLAQTLMGGGLKGMDRKKALARLGVCASMLAGISLLYAMAVGGDPEYEELDDQTKLRNFMIPGTNIMLPMNTTAAFFFKAIPELVYNYITKKGTENEYDARRLRQALSGVALDSLSGPTPIPIAIKPLLEVSVNHSFFTGRSIVPANLKDVEAAEQYTSSTSELGKAISAALEIPGTDGKRVLNPIEADHIVRGLFGTVGAMSQWVTNSIGSIAETRPEPSDKENPFIGTFLREEVPRGKEDLYYDLKGVVDTKYQTWKKMMERGAYEEADAFLDKNDAAISMHDYIRDTDAELKNINMEIGRLGESKDQSLSPKERRKEIDEYKRIKNEILEPVKYMRREIFK